MKLVLKRGIARQTSQEFHDAFRIIAPDGLYDNVRTNPDLIALIEETPNSEDLGYIVVEIPDNCHYVVEKDYEYETEWVYWSESEIHQVP